MLGKGSEEEELDGTEESDDAKDLSGAEEETCGDEELGAWRSPTAQRSVGRRSGDLEECRLRRREEAKER